jgi:hypothetical protein
MRVSGRHDVHRQAASSPSASARLHHGLRTGEAVDLCRTGGAQQSPGAPVRKLWPEAARPLCDLHGEQQPLPGSLRRRRAVRAVLHLRQFLPDAGASSPTSSTTANPACCSRRWPNSTSRARR